MRPSYRRLTGGVRRAGNGPAAAEKSEAAMAGKAVISLSTGLEDPEKVTVAFLVAIGAAESGRPTLMFQAKEAVRLALDGMAAGVACDGCPALPGLVARYEKAGGRFMVCPGCFNAKQLDQGDLLPNGADFLVARPWPPPGSASRPGRGNCCARTSPPAGLARPSCAAAARRRSASWATGRAAACPGSGRPPV